MKTRLQAVAATMILILALATVAVAADPHVGTWKLNLAKSKFTGPAPKSAMITLTAQENGIKSVVDGVDGEGNAIHSEVAAKFDGKDYPITGNPNADTTTLKRIDANTFERVEKKGGKEVRSVRSVVSKDGKTMTNTSKGKDDKGKDFNYTVVFDKQ